MARITGGWPDQVLSGLNISDRSVNQRAPSDEMSNHRVPSALRPNQRDPPISVIISITTIVQGNS